MAKKKTSIKRRSFEALSLRFFIPKIVPDKRKEKPVKKINPRNWDIEL